MEITESRLIEDWAPAIAYLHALRKAGIKISPDDFGTGYPTLSYLHSLPIDCLKIDQNFVQRMEGDASAEAIISTIIQLAESFGMSVIAEGVESEYSARRLQLLGCESIKAIGSPDPCRWKP